MKASRMRLWWFVWMSSRHVVSVVDALSSASKLEFISPLLEAGYPPSVQEYEDGTLSQKPLLLYLPGFDGTLLSPFLQFPELGTEFDIVGMQVDMSDRSTYQDLRQTVIDYLLQQQQQQQQQQTTPTSNADDTDTAQEATTSAAINKNKNAWNAFLQRFTGKATSSSSGRPIYLVGESFGGILTIQVVLELAKLYPDLFQQNLKGIVLVNPATCYARSKLARVGPSVSSERNIVAYVWNLLTQIVPLFTDDYSIAQLFLILQAKALPSIIDTPEREAYMGRTAFTIPQKLKFMTPSTLQWRLTEWLTNGSQDLSTRKEELQTVLNNVPTLIIAGEEDGTLPSIDEAERLLKLIPTTSSVHVVEGAGHASTCGGRVDLAAVMRQKFPEIAQQNNGRIDMKPMAASKGEEWFGMEPRYDAPAQFGLSPLEYWSKNYYTPWKKNSNDNQMQQPS